MKKSLVIVAMLFLGEAYAQVDVRWKTPIEGNPKSIYFHNFTQTPVVETSAYYYGINSNDNSVAWSIKKSEKVAALQAARTASSLTASDDMTKGLDLAEYSEIPYSQFASICGNLIDISTGKVILGESNQPYKSVLSNDIIPELNIVLIKVKAEDGSEVLHAVDLSTDNLLWSTKLADANLTKDALKFVSKANGWDVLSVNLFKPAATASGNVIYNNNGKLALLNAKNGSIIWENDCNPGTFFTTPNQSTILVVEKRSAASNLMSLSGPKPFSKKIIAINAETGKNIWAEPIELEGDYKLHKFLDDNQIAFANKNSVNLYDIQTGKKVWKRDYEADNIRTISLIGDGLEVQFGNKIMAVDLKSGKKAWKKPVEMEDVDDKEEFDILRKEYKNTNVAITPKNLNVYDKASGDRKWGFLFNENDRLTFDDANGKIVVIGKKHIYLLDPDNQNKKPKAADIKIKEPKEIVGCDIKADGYFIYGQKEYIFIKKDGTVVEHKTYEQLQGSRLKRAGLLTASIASGILGTQVTTTYADGRKSESGLFVDPQTAKNFEEASLAQDALRAKLKANDKMRRAVRTNENYAYFLKGDNSNNKIAISLVVVDKQTGKEVKTIDFSSNREVIYEVDSSNGLLYFMDNGNFNILSI